MVGSRAEGVAMKKFLFVEIMICFFMMTGCAPSLLDAEQKRILSNRNKILKSSLSRTYDTIERDGQSGALIVFSATGDYSIFTGDSPIDAITRYTGPLISADAVCVFVFRYQTALPPAQMSCASIRSDAIALGGVKSSLDRLQADVSKANVEISTIRSAINEYDEALTTSFRMGLVNSDILAAQKRQLTQLSQATSTNRKELAEISLLLSSLIRELKDNSAKIEDAIAKLPK